MLNSGVKLVFFGNERLVSGLPHTDTPILQRLIDDGYEIVAIVSNYSESKSRSERPLEVAEIGKKYDIPVLLPSHVKDIEEELNGFGAEAGVLVAYGQIIPQSTIDLFPKGIINIHPSLLPKYRGPTPIETALANGDTTTGISIMQLTAKMDAGPLYAQQSVTIEAHETKFDLYTKLIQLSVTVLSDALPNILDGTLQSQAQDNDEATYCRLFTKEDSWLNEHEQTAAQAERLIRANLTYPKSKLTIHGHDVVIRKAHVSQSPEALTIEFKDTTYLTIDELVGPSGKVMSGSEFLRGYAQ